MRVYHGSIECVKEPDVLHSYRSLDFGKGFYVTTVREQAERWARRKADIYGRKIGIVSVYEKQEEMRDLAVKTFDENLHEWIDFVCACRDGKLIYQKYDVIVGKVANDKVFRVVDMYHSGIWDKERAIKEIRVYKTYDQITFITQRAIDQLLRMEFFYEV